MPTNDVDELYDVFIAIEYKIHEMSAVNKYFLVDNVREAVDVMQEMIERNYLDPPTDCRMKVTGWKFRPSMGNQCCAWR